MKQTSEPAWLSRALRVFTEVRQGEAVTALLMTTNVFLLLSAYYVIKPVREALILVMEGGAEYKAYMSGVIAALLFGLVPLYAKLVDRLPRIKLVVGVTLAFAAQLVLFLLAMGIPSLRANIGLVFYAWVGVFNMMVVAQFWSFANDIYDKDQGDRLFPMVAVGASVGAAVGSQFSAQLLPLLGVPLLLLGAALLLVLCAALFWLVERREAKGAANAVAVEGGANAAGGAPAAAPDAKGKSDAKPKGDMHGAFQMVLSNRYLLYVALFSLIFTWVNSNGEYVLGKLIKADATAAVARGELPAADVGKYIGAAFGEFFFYVNVAGVLLQTFVVSRLVKWLGLPKVFLILPVIALANASVLVILPVLAVFRIGKAAENATDYSINNTVRQMLWLVTSPEMKYKAKQAIDTFFVRMGDVAAALSVWVFASMLALPVQRFAWVSIALVGVWLVLAVAIGREYKRLEAEREEPKATG